ncbi:MAG: hypothetical protein JWQ01_297 [Massilia sp.]|nr:hypothetical protein [Massilia sp.]
MQRFWNGFMRVSAAGLLAGLLLLNVLSSESAWWTTVHILWLVCALGLLVALYFSRRPQGADESYGADPGEDRSGVHHDHSDH